MPDLIATGIQGMDTLFGGGLPKSTSILLLTPPIFETKLLCLEYVYKGLLKEEPGLIVTTDESPESLRQKAEQYNWQFPEKEPCFMSWVDTYSINANREVKSNESVKRIGGPIALSDMAIALSEIQQKYQKIRGYYRYVFDSLSTLLMYSNPNTIYYFLQSIVPKIKESGGVGFYTLSSGMHEEKVVMTLRHLMDGAIEIDEKLCVKILSMPFAIKVKSGKIELKQEGFTVT
ncbi:MAG: RAD55 family ATPase [Candidatus Woesearchaeota archaeon]